MKYWIASLLFAMTFVSYSNSCYAWVVKSQTPKQRIITLAPHLAEIVYALDKGTELIAVSEASNYPESVKDLPTVANYRGVNFTEILRAKPTHILAWQGGNQSKDIQRLRAMGLSVLAVSVESLTDITQQIIDVGTYINATNTAAVATQFANALKKHQKKYATVTPKRVFYYSAQQPLFTIGKTAWVTQLLATCQLHSIYADSAIPYPQANLAFVLNSQPEVIISSQKQPLTELERFWLTHQNILASMLIQADPDQMHRFTPRVLDELGRICATAHL